MTRRVDGGWWRITLPDDVSGGSARHQHEHIETMWIFRGPAADRKDLEVIVTTYPGLPTNERGAGSLPSGEPTVVAGARSASRWEQLTQLDSDPSVPPVRTIGVIAHSRRGPSVVVVVHRPLDAPVDPAERVATSLAIFDVST